jgi:hypothetical protein
MHGMLAEYADYADYADYAVMSCIQVLLIQRHHWPSAKLVVQPARSERLVSDQKLGTETTIVVDVGSQQSTGGHVSCEKQCAGARSSVTSLKRSLLPGMQDCVCRAESQTVCL